MTARMRDMTRWDLFRVRSWPNMRAFHGQCLASPGAVFWACFFFLNSVWGCWGKSVKSTYCLSSPKEFLKLLLPIFVLQCLSGYVGYHLWQTFLYECWHFWCFLMGQHHVGSPVERSQQTFWPRGVRGGDGRQWEDDLGPACLAGVQKAVNTVNSFCEFTGQLVSQNISEMRAFCKHQDTWSKLCLNIPCGCGIPQESVWEAGCHLVIFLEERPWTRKFRDLSFGLFLLAASRSLGKSLLLPWSWLVLIWAIHVNHQGHLLLEIWWNCLGSGSSWMLLNFQNVCASGDESHCSKTFQCSSESPGESVKHKLLSSPPRVSDSVDLEKFENLPS